MTDRYLIVNADDFNTDRQRSQGILKAGRRGIVTSTTALANLPWKEGTVNELEAVFGAGVGVHLNLTKGHPLTGGTRSLVGDDGQFFDKPRAWRRALRGGYELAEVEQEFAAQIARLLDLGIVPSHIDGNNHIHVFPGIAEVVARLALRFGIRRIRLPLEGPWGLRWQWTAKRRFIGLLSRLAARHFAKAGLLFPDHFAGIAAPQPGSPEALRSLLKAMPTGVTELMCHPGYSAASPGGSFSTPEREAELAALTHPLVVQQVRKSGIQLVSFSQIN